MKNKYFLEKAKDYQTKTICTFNKLNIEKWQQ
jgi:hypothetical protein